MSETFDAIVIGSGFGGAITACRLAEKGMKVLVLERGRRWAARDYPRKPGDRLAVQRPRRRRDRTAGSICGSSRTWRCRRRLASAAARSPTAASRWKRNPSLFANGWPAEITYAELKPYYDKVAQVMNLQTLPDGQLTQRFKLAREAAEKLGHADRFSKVPLAVTFSPEWNYELKDPVQAASTPKPSPTRRGSSRARAFTSGTATSAATSAPRTRWISITCRSQKAAAPRSGRCTSSAPSSGRTAATAWCSTGSIAAA